MLANERREPSNYGEPHTGITCRVKGCIKAVETRPLDPIQWRFCDGHIEKARAILRRDPASTRFDLLDELAWTRPHA